MKIRFNWLYPVIVCLYLLAMRLGDLPTRGELFSTQTGLDWTASQIARLITGG